MNLPQASGSWLRCSSCKQFFPKRMGAISFLRRRHAPGNCPLCGSEARFEELSPEETRALVRAQKSSWRHQAAGMLIGAAIVFWLRWIGFF